MLKGKQIENPEVPGMEQNLPPPPLAISASIKQEQNPVKENFSEISSTKNPLELHLSQPADPRIPNKPPDDMQQAHLQNNVSIPWWIPTDADNLFTPFHQASEIVTLKRKHDSIAPAFGDGSGGGNLQNELTGLMKEFRCDLCNAVMNSTAQAKLHYEGKPHQKKIALFLSQGAKKPKLDNESKSMINSESYCDTCKVWFTSQVDASQHYAGKKHIKATTGAQKLKGLKPGSNQLPADSTNRFGIGTGFLPPNQECQNISNDRVDAAVVDPSLLCGYNSGATIYSGALRCDLCNVSANRLEQLETHKRGARHQKMLRFSNLTSYPVMPANNTNVGSTIDYLIYRTPSGSFYCAPCNKSFDSENNFAQHIESKKHKNQISIKSEKN